MTETLSRQGSQNSDPLLDNLAASRYLWTDELARPEQIPDEGDWSVWLYLAGRGSGKTRTASEWVAWQAIKMPKSRGAVIAATFSDVRDTCAEGESGLVAILRRYGVLESYNRSIGEIRLTNGSRIKLFSAAEPDRLRGPQFHYAHCDELAAWDYPETWDQLNFGLRLGTHPRTIVTTTPRPVKVIRDLLERTDDSVHVVRGSTFDNAKNLAPSALAQLRARYEGTRLGRQELYAELLLDTPGALWTQDMLDRARVNPKQELDLVRVILAVDPAVTSGEDSDETGIVVVGKGSDGRGYLLADRSCRDTPSGWAHRAVAAYEEFSCDRVVAEKNQGGDMVELTLRSVMPNISYKGINAKQGKRLRAEPIAALYEQGRISHVGVFEQLEDQLVSWVPDSGYSPDRLDAMVHGFAELDLAFGSQFDAFLEAGALVCETCGYPNRLGAMSCESCHKQFEPEIVNTTGFPFS